MKVANKMDLISNLKILVSSTRNNYSYENHACKRLIELHNHVTDDIKRDNYLDDFYLSWDCSL